MKKIIVLITILLMFSTGCLVYAKPPEPQEVKPYAKDWYVTPEDIIRDIIFPAIDSYIVNSFLGILNKKEWGV